MVRKNRQQVLSNGGRRWGFPPDEVHTRRERVHRVLFHSSVIYAYFGIRHAAAVSRLRIWLVLDHAVTARGTCCVLSCFVGFHREEKERERERGKFQISFRDERGLPQGGSVSSTARFVNSSRAPPGRRESEKRKPFKTHRQKRNSA